MMAVRALSPVHAHYQRISHRGIVDCDDRELELALVCHGSQAVDTGGRLFTSADDLLEHITPCCVHPVDQIPYRHRW